MFFIFAMIQANNLKACELKSGNTITLTKFFTDKCSHCEGIAPHFNEVKDKIRQNNLNLRVNEVNCNSCDCRALDIVSVPTLILSKGLEEINRMRGIAEYEEIVKFLTDNLDIDKHVFEKSIKNSGKVLYLYERDFYSGFDGPWMILFYANRNDKVRGVMEEIAIKHYGKLNVGEISQSNAVNLLHRFNIQSFPAIIVIYNGILAGYNNKNDFQNINAYAERLIEPSFQELNLEKFENLATQDPKTPKFIVFYSNLGMANSYYRKAAHEYKLRTKIYKTSDVALFQKASIYPKKMDDENAKDEEKTVLAVFKDNIFHKCPIPLSEPQEIAHWLFHSHFPNLTKITNDNFYTIFHGIKPAVILLTQGDEFVDLLENAAEKINNGLPFNEQVLAVLDVTEFAMFIPSLLPNFRTPGMVIYDPRRQLFFTQRIRFNQKNFYDDLLSFINNYFADKLIPYPPKKTWSKYIFIGFIVSILYAAYKIRTKKKINAKKQ